jgi:flavin reductase (DIM6/NTAB) family NADH-FMN oxidoreductase RutF
MTHPTPDQPADHQIKHLTPDLSDEGKRSLRNALGHFATGVAVISALDDDGNDIGITVNSFSSVSLDPPLMLWSIGHHSKSLDVFAMHTRFGVNIMAANQENVARHFAASGHDQFATVPTEGAPLSRGLGGIALIGGCISYFECTLEALLPGGDHTILVGRVERFASPGGAPLLFHSGKFRVLE